MTESELRWRMEQAMAEARAQHRSIPYWKKAAPREDVEFWAAFTVALCANEVWVSVAATLLMLFLLGRSIYDVVKLRREVAVLKKLNDEADKWRRDE